MKRRQQRGVALIMAMLLFALLAILGANLAWDSSLDVRRTMSMIYFDEGSQAAYGAENWVSSMLRDDFRDSNTDHLGEIWAAEFPILPIESTSIQGAVTGEIADLQGRFNINSLIDRNGEVNPLTLEQFTRLLRVLQLDPRLAGITADWLDPDQQTGFPDGAEDPIYSSRIPPYRTANQYISTTTELMAIEGMDKETFDTLAPYITALPPGSIGINVNTAPGPVLQSLGENISASDVEALISEREEGGIDNIGNRFQALVTPEELQLLVESSSYFQLKVVVQIDTVRVTYYSVLFRDSGGTGAVVPLWRSFGTI